jgi:hypothetical protein
MSDVKRRPRAIIALLGCSLLSCIGLAAEDEPAARDAAEVVQEGDVSQWLKHYQRERGEDWARQQRGSEATQGAEPGSVPPPGDGRKAGTTPGK